jgi:hypothetical protein
MKLGIALIAAALLTASPSTGAERLQALRNKSPRRLSRDNLPPIPTPQLLQPRLKN